MRLRVAALWLLVCGCAVVNGGAVELSWRLKAASGSTTDFVDCSEDTPVAAIQLAWQVGATSGTASFQCGLGHGATVFDLPVGAALLAVTPVCPSGPAPLDEYTAPAPLEREVVVGETINLGAVEIVVQYESPVQQMTGPQVCGPATAQPCICQ